jgi:toxin FitB
MSFLIDTDILSLLERKRVPAKLLHWLEENDAEIFISAVSFAELQFGVEQAPSSHQLALALWLAEMRGKFISATEEVSEPVLVRWKELIADLKRKNRTLTCEDSLIAATALYHGHTVVTQNRRHFEPAGVEVFNPLEE